MTTVNRDNLATKSAQNTKCLDADVEGLEPVQVYALHTLQHEILAAVFRCYQIVPSDRTDRIVAKFLKKALKP